MHRRARYRGAASSVEEDGSLVGLLEEPSGDRRVDIAKGAAYRREAGVEHNVVNAGSEPMSFIEVEYKRS